MNPRFTPAALFVALALSTSTGVLAAETASSSDALPELHLSATGTVEVAHDWLRVVVQATPAADTQRKVQDALTKAVHTASAQLTPHVAGQKFRVQPGAFEVYPRYDNKGKISQWMGRAELIIEGTDFASISKAAGELDGMTLKSLGYSLSREGKKSVQEAVESDAVMAFKRQAQSLASKFGFDSYQIKSVSVANQYHAQYMEQPKMMRAMATAVADAESTAITGQPGLERVTLTLQGVVTLK